MTENSKTAIQVTGLSKRFDQVQAVAEVDFAVSKGELFGFLGPNGAGKTTTINVLTGLARADTGSVRIGDINCIGNPRAAQHLIGVVPDESNLYPELSGFDNLCFCAALYGLGKREREERARRLLEEFGLQPAAERKFGGYSKGMKRKLTIAAGIIHQPEILFLDEPTTGIDVASARQLRQLIADLNQNGTTIFLTTHYIEEAERLCDRIAFIVEGRIIRTDTVEQLLQPLQNRHLAQVVCHRLPPEKQDEIVRSFPALNLSFPLDHQVRIEAGQPIRVGSLVRFLEERGIEVIEARRLRPSLEDVFVRITGIEAEFMQQEKNKGH